DGSSIWFADAGNHVTRRAVQAKLPDAQGGPTRKFETLGGHNANERYCSKCHGRPVDSATGNMFESVTDLSIAGRGPAMAFTRTYNSFAASHDSPLGYGWSHSYQVSLFADPYTPNTEVVSGEDGGQVSFVQSGASWV